MANSTVLATPSLSNTGISRRPFLNGSVPRRVLVVRAHAGVLRGALWYRCRFPKSCLDSLKISAFYVLCVIFFMNNKSSMDFSLYPRCRGTCAVFEAHQTAAALVVAVPRRCVGGYPLDWLLASRNTPLSIEGRNIKKPPRAVNAPQPTNFAGSYRVDKKRVAVQTFKLRCD